MTSHFQPPSNSLTARDYQFIAVVTIVFLAICAALIYVNLTLKGGGDFYAHWVGSRAFLFERMSPYEGEIAARTQRLVYENPLEAGEEPYLLTTPFHLLPLYYPFAVFSNSSAVRAVFTLLLELALFALAILSLRLTDWESPRLFALLFFFLAVFNYYAFQAVYESSPVLILALCYAGILYAYRAGADDFAGVLAALSFYYWETGLPFLLFFFWRARRENRSRVFAGFFTVTFILLVLAFLTYPDWMLPFLRAVSNNLRVDFGYNVRAVLVDFFPAQGAAFGWILTVGLFILLGYEWTASLNGDFRHFYWTACLSLAAAPLLGFRTEMENLVTLVVPLALILAIVHDRWERLGGGLVILLALTFLGVPWLLSLLAPSAIAGQLIFLFLPLSTLIGLYWIRWWAIRPPRILSDLATRSP
jgi:hypothetical protein